MSKNTKKEDEKFKSEATPRNAPMPSIVGSPPMAKVTVPDISLVLETESRDNKVFHSPICLGDRQSTNTDPYIVCSCQCLNKNPKELKKQIYRNPRNLLDEMSSKMMSSGISDEYGENSSEQKKSRKWNIRHSQSQMCDQFQNEEKPGRHFTSDKYNENKLQGEQILYVLPSKIDQKLKFPNTEHSSDKYYGPVDKEKKNIPLLKTEHHSNLQFLNTQKPKSYDTSNSEFQELPQSSIIGQSPETNLMDDKTSLITINERLDHIEKKMNEEFFWIKESICNLQITVDALIKQSEKFHEEKDKENNVNLSESTFTSTNDKQNQRPLKDCQKTEREKIHTKTNDENLLDAECSSSWSCETSFIEGLALKYLQSHPDFVFPIESATKLMGNEKKTKASLKQIKSKPEQTSSEDTEISLSSYLYLKKYGLDQNFIHHFKTIPDNIHQYQRKDNNGDDNNNDNHVFKRQ